LISIYQQEAIVRNMVWSFRFDVLWQAWFVTRKKNPNDRRRRFHDVQLYTRGTIEQLSEVFPSEACQHMGHWMS
jgi:hypothetical protein